MPQERTGSGKSDPPPAIALQLPSAPPFQFPIPGNAASMAGMQVFTDQLTLQTKGKGTYEITNQVLGSVRKSGLNEGMVTVFVRHTSCSLLLFENADRSAREDLETFFDRLVPEDLPYLVHTAEGPDDMPSHLRMALTRTSEVVPLSRGRLLLGTWQGLFLFEHRRAPHTRRIVISIIGES